MVCPSAADCFLRRNGVPIRAATLFAGHQGLGVRERLPRDCGGRCGPGVTVPLRSRLCSVGRLDIALWPYYHIGMNHPRTGQYEAWAEIAKALAHPTRLLMLDALKRKEACVCEMTELIGADQSTVSKHLAILKNAGLVECRKEGTLARYRVRCRCLTEFFECIESVLRQNVKAQQAALTGRRAASS